MLLTTKVSYGIRALITLACSYEKEGALSIKKISGKEEISSVYLEQIFSKLKKKKIITSIRGPKGGYTLTKSPQQVNLLEIVLALDGSVAPGKCVSKKTGKTVCTRAGICPSKEVWDEIEMQIKGTLEKYKLSDLVKRSAILSPEVT